jgi:ribosomal protein S18 acetylase RimI-like enzyme
MDPAKFLSVVDIACAPHGQRSAKPQRGLSLAAPIVFQLSGPTDGRGGSVPRVVARKQMTMPANTSLIRNATADDVARIRIIARAAYGKYVPRIGREPAPMGADFEAETTAQRVVVMEAAGNVSGYMIAWPEADAYFIDNIAVDPKSQGEGLGRRLIEHAVAEANRLHLPALRLYTNMLMTENLAMYAHIGFVETDRAIEKGFHRVYMRWNLPKGQQ